MSRKPLGQEVSEEAILEVAKKYFCKYGFDNTNLNDIAAEMNITRTPIYYYFESKQKLYEAVAKKHLTGKLEKYTELFASDMPFFDKVRVDLELSSHLRLAEKELFTGVDSKPALVKVKEFQTDMLAFFDREHPEIVQEIEVRRVLDDDLTEKILNAAKEFKEKR